MSTDERKARIESALLNIWYSGQKPGLVTGLTLGLLECTYKALRWATRQNYKSIAAKKASHPPVLVVGNLIAGAIGGIGGGTVLGSLLGATKRGR